MNILIFSISAGGGHQNAAEAIKECAILNDKNSKVEIIDTLKYINPLIDKLVIGSYLNSIKINPYLYKKLYYQSEDDDTLSSISAKFNEVMSERIVSLIKNFNPDVIIATHPFPEEMLSILKGKKMIDVPVICILTDYAVHSLWVHPNIDAFIVSNSDMINEMTMRNVDKNLVHVLGIPVKNSFLKNHDRKQTLKELGFSSNLKTVLIMGGSLGIGKISKIYDAISRISIDIQIIAITGNNKKLYNDLIKLKENSKKETRIIGYTNEVNKYMQCCDLLVTKPGGLTVTEAIITGTPMAAFSAIPGAEDKNLDFILKHNIAVYIDNEKNCGNIIEKLLLDDEKLKDMGKNCRMFSKPNAGNDIYKLILNLIQKNSAI